VKYGSSSIRFCTGKGFYLDGILTLEIHIQARREECALLKHLLPHATMDLVHAKGDHMMCCIMLYILPI